MGIDFPAIEAQPEIVALWSSLLPQILQGVQIDTSHWRHLFLMCGCLYGLASAERIERSRGSDTAGGRQAPRHRPPDGDAHPPTARSAPCQGHDQENRSDISIVSVNLPATFPVQPSARQSEASMTLTAGIPGDRILSFIERIEQIEEELKALNEGKKEVFSEAKGEGFDGRC